MSINGKVKWYNGTKGFGFIARDDKEKDVFVHRTAIEAAGMRDLKEGEQLTFDVDIAAKGPCAVNLQKPDLNS
jgi:CspA family cold shock protein